ncbi:MAG: acyl-CoA dehydrogenase family protein, partial [Vicinamibacterales bacterium]|nr:acyl-CoA dehydrogenase family protein [Vicinamibacterales bacterium]
EQVKSMAMYAALMCDEGDAETRDLALSTAKVKMCDAARFVGQMSIQLHGGAGICDDFGLSAAWAHARTLRLADGPDEVHRRAVARMELRKSDQN